MKFQAFGIETQQLASFRRKLYIFVNLKYDMSLYGDLMNKPQ